MASLKLKFDVDGKDDLIGEVSCRHRGYMETDGLR